MLMPAVPPMKGVLGAEPVVEPLFEPVQEEIKKIEITSNTAEQYLLFILPLLIKLNYLCCLF